VCGRRCPFGRKNTENGRRCGTFVNKTVPGSIRPLDAPNILNVKDDWLGGRLRGGTYKWSNVLACKGGRNRVHFEDGVLHGHSFHVVPVWAGTPRRRYIISMARRSV